MIASEKMRDRDEDHRPQRCGGERVPETSTKDLQLHKNPAADEGANDSQNDVRNAAEAPAPRNLSCEPSGDQADQQPSPESVRHCNPDTPKLDQHSQRYCRHSASWHMVTRNLEIVAQAVYQIFKHNSSWKSASAFAEQTRGKRS